MNDVGFVISEDLSLGPGTRLDHSSSFVQQNFIKVKASDIDIRRQRVPPSLVLAGELYNFSIGYYSKSKECFKVVKALPDPLPQFTF